MGRPSRYSPEVRERSVRLVLDQADKHSSQWAAIQSVAHSARNLSRPESCEEQPDSDRVVLRARLDREDRLIEPRSWKKCTLFDINYRPANMSVDELRDGFRRLAVDLYSDEFTNWRRSNFRRSLRDRRRPEGAKR